jgi:hypothetical protein
VSGKTVAVAARRGSVAPENTALRELGTGRFLKGHSGNPGGRPTVDVVRQLARDAGPAAIARLVRALKSKDERVGIAAAVALLDRGFGRPAQTITGPDGGPLELLGAFTAAARAAARKDVEDHGETEGV